MYDLVDRPMSELAPCERFVLIATRLWVQASLAGRDPAGRLRDACAEAGVTSAAAPLHQLFTTLADAPRSLALHCPCAGVVGDDEAVLLATWRRAWGGDAATVRSTAALLVGGARADVLTASWARAVRELPPVGLQRV